MTEQTITPGDVLHLGRAASVQFIRPITVRVIRVLHDWHTYQGWLWVDAYELGPGGAAVARRSLYVMPAGADVVKRAPRTEVPRRPLARTRVPA
ncbi:hypothetical protein [Micromonospora sp. NPDC092111]|uniref:hypothetical protein n=1 Tax=Micromonospora sp. NPDC092111 TaxID=3364289 RepID=UPI003808EC01